MSTAEEVNRRNWLKVVGAAATALAIGAAAGWYNKPAEERVVTQTVTTAGTVTLPFQPTKFTLASYFEAESRWHAKCSLTCPIECDTPPPDGLGGKCPQPFGTWSPSYQNRSVPSFSAFSHSGNMLQTSIAWYDEAHLAKNVKGNSMIFVYDEAEDRWIMQGARVQYAGKRGLTVADHWQGYFKFNGTPSASTFTHGVGYKWSYVYLPQSEEPKVNEKYPTAVWDEAIKAWLVGFSIYLLDIGNQSYSIPFPSPFIKPVAGNYNSLNL